MRAPARLTLVALLVVVTASCQHAVRPRWRMFPEPATLPVAEASGYVPVNGAKLFYQVFNAGGGDPVVLLHGGLGSAENWGNQVPALMRGRRVITLESRGHGRSTRDSRPCSCHLMAEDLLAVLDFLRLEKPALVGWSDGATIGLDFAQHHPERLSRLYVFGAGYDPSGARPDALKNPDLEVVFAAAGKTYARLSSTPERFDEFAQTVTQMWEREPNFTAADLRRIVVPTCVVQGEHDEFTFTSHVEELARRIPGARFELLRDVSHFAPVQDPERFNRSLLAFLCGK